jgi:hypothetical protein
MSSFLAPARARARITGAAQQRARLFLVRGGRTDAPRVPFAAFVLAVLGLGLVGLLVLNTSLQQGAFHARDLEARAERLTEQREALELHVAELRDPQRVAARAAELGMVPNPSPAFLRLRDGKVLGNPTPATPEAVTALLSPQRAARANEPRTGSSGGGTPARERQGSDG